VNISVRLGEWDAATTTEPIAAQEFIVSRIFIHPQFTAANLKNGIAILRLATAVPLGQTPTIGTACLPSNALPVGTKCSVAGEHFLNKSGRNLMKFPLMLAQMM
jgi:hypothetical protein